MSIVENLSEEELKKLKRDASIRAKDAEFEKKRQEEEERKRQQLEQLKEEYDRLEQKKLEDRLATLRKRAAVRAQQEAERAELHAKRENKIAAKQEAWGVRTLKEIEQIKDEAQQEEERIEENLEKARERKTDKLAKMVEKKLAFEATREELDMKRTENIQERDARRDVREISRVDQLKTEAQQELQVFVQNPFPVPLRQVLAGRVRPVPKVTELLAAYRDQRELLEDLEQQDIPMRAQLRNQPVMAYVRDIRIQAESEHLKPPEPVVGDTGRSNGRIKRGIGSPTGRSGRGSPSGRKSPSRTGTGWKSPSRTSTRR